MLTVTTVVTSLVSVMIAVIGMDRVLFNMWVNADYIINSVCLLLYSKSYNKIYYKLCFMCHKYPEYKLRQNVSLKNTQLSNNFSLSKTGNTPENTQQTMNDQSSINHTSNNDSP